MKTKLFHVLSFVAGSRRGCPTEVMQSLRGGGDMYPNVVTPPVWSNGPKRALILMDRFAEYHGIYLQRMAMEVYGVAVVNVLSPYLLGYFSQEHPELEEPKTMGIPADEKDWIEKIDCGRIEAIICESDSGLAEAEAFGARLKLSKHNGINEARRDKYLMIEAVGKAGLQVVEQKLCNSVEEACEFAKKLGILEGGKEVPKDKADLEVKGDPTGLLGMGRNSALVDAKLCVVKPTRGVASDSVFLCSTLDEVKDAFQNIYGETVFGSMGDKNDAVLVQDFAVGTEYALDIVSKNGVHKIAALWRYDKRPTNGRSFVYHATELVGCQSSEAEAVCEYATATLNALNIKWGMTHTEVIQTRDGCRLVEVNCRQHNMDFAPITMACIGYNALDMLLCAYLGDGGCAPGYEESCLEWNLLPDRPVLRAFGAMVHLVSHVHGTLIGVNEVALREIQSMASVLDLQVYNHFLSIGNEITQTVDIRTDAGWVQMINDDAEAFARDYNRIVELMPTLFVVHSKEK